jgi:LmbE family N-acetylglucosaminyl deacetylase
MFRTGDPPSFRYSIKPGADWREVSLRTRILDANGRELRSETSEGALEGTHTAAAPALPPGRYVLEVAILSGGATVAHNRLEFAINSLPRSILVFGAHEDDDTAHPAIIRAAVENHIPIHFVYWTSGDAGGCDRFYMHSCDAARAMDFGEARMDETRASLGHLGVPRENIAFLGLPDGGLEQIWNHVSVDRPYLSVLLASDHAPYRDAAIPNMPYARDAAVAAAKQFLLRYRPDMVITGHPDERHVDHRVNNWIVVKAMQDLLRDGKISPQTQLVVDVAYGAVPDHRAPYRYEKYSLFVSGEAARLGQEALWYYQSQDGNHQQAEIVDYDKLPRKEAYPHFRILDWQEHAGWNERP